MYPPEQVENLFGNTYSHYDMFLYMFSLLHTHQTKLWHHDPQLTCLQNITGRHKIYCISFEAQDSAGVHHLERQVHLIINFSSLSWQQGNISRYPTRKQGCGFEYLTSIQNYTSPKSFKNNGTYLYARGIYFFLLFFLNIKTFIFRIEPLPVSIVMVPSLSNLKTCCL